MGTEHYGRLVSVYFSISLRGQFPDQNKKLKNCSPSYRRSAVGLRNLEGFGGSKGAGLDLMSQSLIFAPTETST